MTLAVLFPTRPRVDQARTIALRCAQRAGLAGTKAEVAATSYMRRAATTQVAFGAALIAVAAVAGITGAVALEPAN